MVKICSSKYFREEATFKASINQNNNFSIEHLESSHKFKSVHKQLQFTSIQAYWIINAAGLQKWLKMFENVQIKDSKNMCKKFKYSKNSYAQNMF